MEALITNKLFEELVEAASLAPSADNMQPWTFRRQDNSIEVFCEKSRILPTDVLAMFAWVGIGAAIQNIMVAAASHGLIATVQYNTPIHPDALVASLQFLSGNTTNHLADFIKLRNTNRHSFEKSPLHPSLIHTLSESIHNIDASVHWTTSYSDFKLMASMDAHSSYIRLEHKPLHDELFDILRFSKHEIEDTRFGLTFKSLGVPGYAVFFARQLQYWSVNRAVSHLGFGRLIAKQLSNKLCNAGAICLITAHQQTPVAYMEAGRALEQLWLVATKEELSVQPYGVLPQYLTKIEIEPETFLPKYVTALEKHRKPFFSIFPDAVNEHPAIVLRLGKTRLYSARSDIRLKYNQIVQNNKLP